MDAKDNNEDRPEHAAKELAWLASRTANPAARVWYLEWANAFQRLAQRRADEPEATPDQRDDN